MPSGLANKEKQRVRQLYRRGQGRPRELLEAEAASYHGAGTCTFYGTANSNQMMMEVMGLHMPGAAFINPGTQAAPGADPRRRAPAGRDRLGRRRLPPAGRAASTRRRSSTPASACSRPADRPTMRSICRRSRARRGSSSTGRISTELSAAVPLIARVYPNGSGDVNHFHAAGGMAFVIRELARCRAAPPRHHDRGGQATSSIMRASRCSTDDALVWDDVLT